MKCFTIILFIVLISAPTARAKKILTRKRRDPFTFTVLAALIFFLIYKGGKAFILRRKGKLAEQVAIQMAREMGIHNQTVSSIITSCRNAHKLYDQKMVELVKLEKIFIKIKAYQIQNNIQCYQLTDSNATNSTKAFKADLINRLAVIKREVENYQDELKNNKQEPSTITDQEYFEKRKNGETKLVCYVASVKSHISQVIEQFEKFANIDVSNFCSADILTYFSQTINNSKGKIAFIKQTETVLKQSTNFFYRLFMSKAHENISSILDIRQMSVQSQGGINNLINRIRTKEGIKSYSWKDPVIGILRGGMEVAAIFMSIEDLFSNGFKALKEIFSALSIGFPKDAGDFLAGNRTADSDKNREKGINVSASVNFPKYLGGIEWFGVGRIIFAMIEYCYSMINEESFSFQVENQFGRAFSPITGERDQFVQFSKLHHYQLVFQQIKMARMIENLDKLTKHVQIDEIASKFKFEEYKTKDSEFLAKYQKYMQGYNSTHQSQRIQEHQSLIKLETEINRIRNSSSFGSIIKVFEGTNYRSFRLLMMKKEFTYLTPVEHAILNNGKYYITIRTAYGIAELLSYLRDGFELLESHSINANAREQMEREIDDQLDLYKEVFKDGEPELEREIDSYKAQKRKVEEENKINGRSAKAKMPWSLEGKLKLYVLAKRTEGYAKSSVLLFLKIVRKEVIMARVSESESNYKHAIETNLKTHLENEMIKFYESHCNGLDFKTELISLVKQSKMKIRVLYDNYLGYLKIDKTTYEDAKFKKFITCFNILTREQIKSSQPKRNEGAANNSRGNFSFLSQVSYYSELLTKLYQNDANDIKVLKYYYDSSFTEINSETVFFYKNTDFKLASTKNLSPKENVSSLKEKIREELKRPPSRFPPNTYENNKNFLKFLDENDVSFKFWNNTGQQLDSAEELMKLSYKNTNRKFSWENIQFDINDTQKLQWKLVSTNFLVKYGDENVRFQDLFEVFFGLGFEFYKNQPGKKGLIQLSYRLKPIENFTFYQIFRGQTSDYGKCLNFKNIFKYANLNPGSENPRDKISLMQSHFFESIDQKTTRPDFINNGAEVDKYFKLKDYLLLPLKMKGDEFIVTEQVRNSTEERIKDNLQIFKNLKYCSYATFSVEITFREMPANPKFYLVPIEDDVELSAEKNETGEIEVEGNPVVTFTFIGHPEGSKEESTAKANIIEHAENRYNALGYRKIKESHDQNPYEYYVFFQNSKGKKTKYIKVSFWEKVKTSSYEKTLSELEKMQPESESSESIDQKYKYTDKNVMLEDNRQNMHNQGNKRSNNPMKRPLGKVNRLRLFDGPTQGFDQESKKVFDQESQKEFDQALKFSKQYPYNQPVWHNNMPVKGPVQMESHLRPVGQKPIAYRTGHSDHQDQRLHQAYNFSKQHPNNQSVWHNNMPVKGPIQMASHLRHVGQKPIAYRTGHSDHQDQRLHQEAQKEFDQAYNFNKQHPNNQSAWHNNMPVGEPIRMASHLRPIGQNQLPRKY